MPNDIKQFILSNYGNSYGSPLNLVVANSRTVLVGPKSSAKPSEASKLKKGEEGPSITKESVVLASSQGNVTPVITKPVEA